MFPPKGAIIGISLLLVAWMTGIAGVIVFKSKNDIPQHYLHIPSIQKDIERAKGVK